MTGITRTRLSRRLSTSENDDDDDGDAQGGRMNGTCAAHATKAENNIVEREGMARCLATVKESTKYFEGCLLLAR